MARGDRYDVPGEIAAWTVVIVDHASGEFAEVADTAKGSTSWFVRSAAGCRSRPRDGRVWSSRGRPGRSTDEPDDSRR
jgi:hypothetical protein